MRNKVSLPSHFRNTLTPLHFACPGRLAMGYYREAIKQ
jgi:hypothetical protein